MNPDPTKMAIRLDIPAFLEEFEKARYWSIITSQLLEKVFLTAGETEATAKTYESPSITELEPYELEEFEKAVNQIIQRKTSGYRKVEPGLLPGLEPPKPREWKKLDVQAFLQTLDEASNWQVRYDDLQGKIFLTVLQDGVPERYKYYESPWEHDMGPASFKIFRWEVERTLKLKDLQRRVADAGLSTEIPSAG